MHADGSGEMGGGSMDGMTNDPYLIGYGHSQITGDGTGFGNYGFASVNGEGDGVYPCFPCHGLIKEQERYWSACIPLFVEGWPLAQRRRLRDLENQGALIAFWRSDI